MKFLTRMLALAIFPFVSLDAHWGFDATETGQAKFR